MTMMTGIVHWRRASLAFHAGLVLTLLLVLLAALSFLWTPHTIDGVAVSNALKPPSANYWLGTDHFGRDVVSLLMAGARTSIIVALLAVLIGILLGVALGTFLNGSLGAVAWVLIQSIIYAGYVSNVLVQKLMPAKS